MPSYCQVEDVLRVYGGTLANVQMHHDRRLWDGSYPVTSVTVDTNTFDVPNLVLARITKNIEFASSRLDAAILQAYRARPTLIPDHLVVATAKIAALDSSVDDGTETDSLRREARDVKAYFAQIAKMDLDLGIEAPRPRYRAPAVSVAQGVGLGPGGAAARRRRLRGICGDYGGGCC